MKREWEVVLSLMGADPGAIARLELATGARSSRRTVGSIVYRLRNEEDATELHTLGTSLGLRLLVRETVRYSGSDLRQAQLLVLQVTRAPRGEGGPRHGTSYDMASACPACGTGAEQLTPLRLWPSDVTATGRATALQTLDREILLSAPVALVLTRAGVEGSELVQAESPRGSALPWVQLRPRRSLPAMDPLTRGVLVESQCPACRRDGHFGSSTIPMEIVYRGIDVAALPSILRSWECFGNSVVREPFARSVLAHPLILVKPLVMEALKGVKVRGLAFTPVRVLNGQD